MARFAVISILAWAVLVRANTDEAAVTVTRTRYLPWKPIHTADNGNCYCVVGGPGGMITLSTPVELF